MNYCSLYDTPEFQHAVDNLRDTFGTEAEKIAYKSFMENGQQWLSPEEIIEQVRNDYFTVATPKRQSAIENNLRTFDFGSMEGQPQTAARNKEIHDNIVDHPDLSMTDQGESFNQAFERVTAMMDRLVKEVPDNTVLVTHNSVFGLIYLWDKEGRPEFASREFREKYVKQDNTFKTGSNFKIKERGKNIWIQRHGETWDNLDKKFRTPDTQLTDKGRQEAAEAGEKLADIKIAKIISSPLPRAIETANIILSKQTEAGEPMVKQAFNRELTMTQKEIFADLGISVPKKQLSNRQLINLRTAISRANNRLYKEGMNRNYQLYDVKQVGQSDNYTWRVAALPGKIDIAAKAQRMQETALDKNKLPGTLVQGTFDIDRKNFISFLRETNPQTALMMELTQQDDNVFRPEQNFGYEAAQKLAKELSDQIGVDYQMITDVEAIEITKDTQNPWKGEKAFFLGDRVYFVGDAMTPETVLHEFAHPLLRSIQKQNTKLFTQLYTKLASTTSGKQIIEEVGKLYKELENGSPLFQEEVMVRALTKAYDMKEEGLAQESGFKKFIEDLLYQIKQLLRKVFGQKVAVSKLSPETTLEQLADMLRKGDKFDLGPQDFNEADIASYIREYNKQMGELLAKNLNAEEVEKLTNDYFDLAKKQIRRLRNAEDFKGLLEVVKNKYKSGELEQITKNLKPWQSKIIQDAIEMENEIELTQHRATAVINSMSNLGNLMDKVYAGLQELVKDVNSPENVRRIDYYHNTIKYWEEFVKTASDVLEKDGVQIPMIDHINTLMRQSSRLVEKFYEDAVGDIIYKELSGAAADIDAKWQARKEFLEKKNTPQSKQILEAERKIYEAGKLTPQVIKDALKGNIKDMSFAGKWLEPYGYSPNPIVGGISLFIKNALASVDAQLQANVNTQADELRPLLDVAGYNPNNAKQLGIDLGQKEKVGSVNNETGEFEEIEEWRFINPFIGADLARQKLTYEIRTLSDKYQQTHTEEDKQALADKQAELDQHLLDFWHQENKPEFYRIFEPFKRDAVGKKAKMLMDEINAQMDEIRNDYVSAEDEVNISEQLESLSRQYKQLSSLTDVFGNKKTGEDLEIAERIQEYNRLSKEVYEAPVEIPDAFNNAYWNFRQRLADEGVVQGSERWNSLMDRWKANNTRTVIDEEFWETLNDVNARIKAILETLPQDTATKLQIEESYLEIKNLLTGQRDESGQPVGAEMTEESLAKVKAAQEKILKAQEFLNKTTGLTKAEQAQQEILFAKIGQGNATQEDYINLNRLLDKQDAMGLDRIKRIALKGLYAKLDDLRQREPTDSYIDTVNAYLNSMTHNPLYDKIGDNGITKTNAYVILDENILAELFSQSPEFEKWFKENHFKRWAIDQSTGLEVEKWEKTYAWNVIRPKDPQYLKKTAIRDEDGNVVEEIIGVPTMKYFKKLVKPEYKNESIVGVTTTNRGETDWLPRTVEQGAKDDRFINKAYFNLRAQNPARFKLLEKMKEVYLRNQQNAHKEARLYMSYPRYAKPSLERLASEKPVERVIDRAKQFWQGVKDKWSEGLNFEADVQYTKLDLFDSETSGVPIMGLAKMDINEVSTDILHSMMKYQYSSLRQKKLIEIAPTVKAIQQIVNNEKNFPFVQQAMGSRTIIDTNKRQDKSVMASAINAIVNKTFEGKNQIGWGSDIQWVQNLSQMMFKQASFAYLALNVPSALKNQLSMKWQNLIEASAGRYFTFKDFLAAESIATSTTFQISSEIYKKGSKSLNHQLVQLFDPERDRFRHGFGESLSRTPGKDTLKPLERMNDFRRWLQLQASLQTFFAMMKNTKVKQGDKEIPYLEAWEVKDGKLQLKDGVDKEWGISYDKDGNQIVGEKYTQKRNQIQGVLDTLNGAMGSDTRAEVERYLLGKYLMFFRRWMTRMFVNRFAYSGSLWKGTSRGRLDPILGQQKMGWYIDSLKLLYKGVRSMGSYFPYATKDEKAAIIRLGTEIGTLILIGSLLPALMGYDPDDKERLAKLRAKSGALPLPGVEEDPNRPFQFGGWLENHLLLLILQTTSEQNQFLPLPVIGGLNQYSQYTDIKSIVMGPTLKTYGAVLEDMGYGLTGSEKAFYQKDVGPWEFQQQDARKVWAHIAKAVGLSGAHVDPAAGLKNWESIQNR